MSRILALLMVLLAMFAARVQAGQFYWAVSEPDPNRFGSASEACEYWFGRSAPSALFQSFESSMDKVSDTEALCKFVYEIKPEHVPRYGYSQSRINVRIFRFGTTCPEGTRWNSEMLRCEAPEPEKCASTIGQFVEHQHKIGTLSEGGVVLQNTRTEPPGSLCQNSCQYASTGEAPSRCYRFMEGGDQNSGFCVFRYKGNGVECPNTDPTPNTPPATLPTREKANECTNKVTDGEGRVHYSCLATDTFKEPGNMQCGEVNGVFGCKEGKPSPTKKETETKTEVSEQTASDGSSTTSTTTTTTTTNCTGVNACSTTTSVTNGTSKTNADGTSGGESSTCTGTGCKASDKPGEEDKEEEEEPEREISGTGDCDAPVQCSGDAIDCAMVQQQKTLRCEVEEQGDFDKHKGEIEAAVQGDKFELAQDSEIQAPSFLDSGARFLPSSCPPDKTFSLKTNGGRSFSLSYEPLCSAASDLGVLILIGTSVFCALYVGRAFGGE